MDTLNFLFFFDISTMLLMVILAYLSKRLGEAMKIKSYYKLLYVTTFLVLAASGIDFAIKSMSIPVSSYIPLLIRLISSLTAFLVCLRYWNWLFPEFIKR